MKRLTTDDPKDNIETALNLFYIKDHETWVRGGGPGPEYADVSLFDYTRQLIKTHIPDADLSMDDDDLSMMMAEWLFDGPESLEGVIATLYTAAWAYAELRHRLAAYEDADTALDSKDTATAEKRSCDNCWWNEGTDNCPDEIDRGLQCGIDCFGCICGRCEEGSEYKPRSEPAKLDEPEWKQRVMRTFLGGR